MLQRACNHQNSFSLGFPVICLQLKMQSLCSQGWGRVCYALVSLSAFIYLVGHLTACPPLKDIQVRLTPGLQHSSIMTWSQAAWKNLGSWGA